MRNVGKFINIQYTDIGLFLVEKADGTGRPSNWRSGL